MLQCNVQDFSDMSIGQGIVGVLSFLLKFYKIIIPQDFQLMRNGGFGHIQKDRQVTYTHFVAVQCLHNTASGIITEDLKEFGHTLSLIFRHDVFLYMFQNVIVDRRTVAAGFCFTHNVSPFKTIAHPFNYLTSSL